jgi:Zn-dependent protease with chaperone function
MNLTQSLYPASPAGVPLTATNPSANFKKEVKKVLGSIVLFFVVYLILIILAALLSIACIYAGFFVMGNSGHLIGIIAGVGIMSIGVMVVIFLIKFIFSVKKYDESGTVVITESEQPQLFAFIRQLTTDTHTQFPKKIIVSPEVNASVFYNDSFWSMIFPVKKNLKIGLGLVNSLTLSEFKAVMAHEFGHFSQRSMKLGSFVYNVNKAVYNMLYENKDYGNFLQKWGSLHWAISIFVWVTIQIIKGIQQILQGMYSLINKNYMGLSREMEFHADAVAASVSGSNNLISALQKIEISDVCYQTVLDKADELVGEKTKLQNIYHNHDAVMQVYAAHNNLPLQNATPVADEEFFKKFQYNKINIKNQWASHPPREERNAHLQQLNIPADNDTRPAWIVFNQPEALQRRLSDMVYRSVPGDRLEQDMNAAAFKEKYQQDISVYNLPAAYNGYYDDNLLQELDMEAVLGKAAAIVVSKENFEGLFSDEWIGLIKKQAGDRQDAAILKAITDNQVEVKTFDYDGDKKEKEEAPALLKQLEASIELQQQKLQQHHEAIAAFFHKVAMEKGSDTASILKEKYKAYFASRKDLDELIGSSQRVVDLLAPLLDGQTVSINHAEEMAQGLRRETNFLKPMLGNWLQQGLYDTYPELKSKVENFVQATFVYFNNPSFMDAELGTLHRLVNETPALVARAQFRSFKALLCYQLEIYNLQV